MENNTNTLPNLSQLFSNNSDCYADTRIDHGDNYLEGDVIQAITKEEFIEIAHEYAVLFARHHLEKQIEAIKENIKEPAYRLNIHPVNFDKSIENSYPIDDKIK